MPSTKETKCVNAFSNYQITQHETEPEMVKLFKKYIRSYVVDISFIHEDFEEWMFRKINEDCEACSKEKKCPKCLKILNTEMKDRMD